MWSWRGDGLGSDHTGRNSKHIYVGETRLVTKIGRADGSFTNEEKLKQYWYHSDHLGSTQLISNVDGEEYERIEYTPYGELWIEKASAATNIDIPYRFTGKERDDETGLYYYGARYLDPKYSRWLSPDPALSDYIPGAPINDEVKKKNGELPGMGGVFNTVNLHLYHYAGNNPVKYTDPTGKSLKGLLNTALNSVKNAAGNYQDAVTGKKSGLEFYKDTWKNMLETFEGYFDNIKNILDGGTPSIPEGDKDKIAQHSYEEGHGAMYDLDIPTEEGIREKIDEVLTNPDTQVGARERDGAMGYLAPDGSLLIHNPSDEDNKGTMFKPNNPQEYFDKNFPEQ
jgi:RHS repeat-associated protein